VIVNMRKAGRRIEIEPDLHSPRIRVEQGLRKFRLAT
jgi:hypothetical protein